MPHHPAAPPHRSPAPVPRRSANRWYDLDRSKGSEAGDVRRARPFRAFWSGAGPAAALV